MNSEIRCVVLALLLFLCPSWIEAQEFMYHNGTMRMPYREVKFHQQKEGKSALVIYLHPRSARGHNNDTQEKTGAFRQLAKYLEDHDMKAVLIAPQCEESRHWNEYSSPLGKYLSDVVKDLVDDYSTSHDIDPCRIYALGESFGGSGVWRLVTDYTDFFAAAMPAVCSPKLKDLKKFVNLKKCAKTPLCLVSGEKDEVYGPSVMAPYVEELTKRKCDLHNIVLPGKTHYQSCFSPFPEEGLDWLFRHKRM